MLPLQQKRNHFCVDLFVEAKHERVEVAAFAVLVEHEWFGAPGGEQLGVLRWCCVQLAEQAGCSRCLGVCRLVATPSFCVNGPLDSRERCSYF